MSKYQYGQKYKLKNLDIFVDDEWLINDRRKFRTVFDKAEIDYLFFNVTIYNKLFDEEDWEATFKFVVTDSDDNKICELTEHKKIPKEENTFYLEKGWGNSQKGRFWKENKYRLQVFIDDNPIGEKYFYVYDWGLVTPVENPYFNVISVKITEDGRNLSDKFTYYKQLKKGSTRYVWVELCVENKYHKDWKMEYFVNIFDEAGQPKVQIRKMIDITGDKGNKIYHYSGWGNEEGNTWQDDKYTVNIVFMDNLVASTTFTMGDSFIEGETELLKNQNNSPVLNEVASAENNDISLSEQLEKLNALIGLESIKTQIKKQLDYIEFLKIRKEKGFEETDKINLHSVFTGNPGTGKTTVVKMLGNIYQKMGLLSTGHVHEVDRTHLVGEYLGQTAPKTKKAIEKARGGILFIDEAYALYRNKGDKKDYGSEVIEILLKEMSDGKGDIAIMFAGYPKEMEAFINSNPGLKSRIGHFFHFPDYTPDELLEIAKFSADKKGLNLSDDALIIIKKILTDAFRKRDNSFGNARFSISIIDSAKINMGLRLMKSKNLDKLTKKELSTIKKEDVEPLLLSPQGKKLDFKIDKELLLEAQNELNELIGLKKIKNDINELIKLVRYYREIGRDVLNSFSLHAVFTGNPGTGKTTVARIIGKIYKALGLLERGQVVETDRESFIAGYVGQTAIKTKKVIDNAIGGVLFIDEAYGLTSSEYSYGAEAIQVILKNMEDKRGKFAVIVAGYPDNMDKFLRTNPGLMSRFDKIMHFNDFSVDELMKIAKLMFDKNNLVLDDTAQQYLLEYVEKVYNKRDKNFGNARFIRKLVDDVSRKQNLRMADIPNKKRTATAIRTVTLDDVSHLKTEDKGGKKSLGFKFPD